MPSSSRLASSKTDNEGGGRVAFRQGSRPAMLLLLLLLLLAGVAVLLLSCPARVAQLPVRSTECSLCTLHCSAMYSQLHELLRYVRHLSSDRDGNFKLHLPRNETPSRVRRCYLYFFISLLEIRASSIGPGHALNLLAERHGYSGSISSL